MALLSLDTCDARGSIALVEGRHVVAVVSHPVDLEYSSWLIPSVNQLLSEAKLTHSDLEGYVVAAGPGSFTGVRVGLTTVKAWGEVFTKPIYSVSRLQALAHQVSGSSGYVASFIDAQRKQLFGAVYHRTPRKLSLVGEERVIDPAEFLEWVAEVAGELPVAWASLDPDLLSSHPAWPSRAKLGEAILPVYPPLAPWLVQEALFQRPSDALALDANYVRRSDAEIFGKKSLIGNA